ncbi:MAG: ATPase [Pseudomonadota bacterium]
MTSIQRCFLALCLTVPASGTANADILGAAANGFHINHRLAIEAGADAVWAALGEPAAWWDSDHTYTADASNLTLALNPLGCFCEATADGGAIVHMTVTAVRPGKMLRLTGGLGPLGLVGVDGNMVFSLTEGDGVTYLKFDYAVGGYSTDGLAALASAVDGVTKTQIERLKRYTETGSPGTGP